MDINLSVKAFVAQLKQDNKELIKEGMGPIDLTCRAFLKDAIGEDSDFPKEMVDYLVNKAVEEIIY